MQQNRFLALKLLALAAATGCGQSSGSDGDRPADGPSTGGVVGAGGTQTNGGTASAAATGGTLEPTGATTGMGGSTASGGVPVTGGTATGGAPMGGSVATGGVQPYLGSPPLQVVEGLFDQDQLDDLGLSVPSGAETFTIFSPSDATDHYSNGVVLIGFKGQLYAQWQSSATDEDSADTWVAYSHSADGEVWSGPVALVSGSGEGVRTSGGFWTDGETLVAYINVWPSTTSPRGGYTEFLTSTDGVNWSDPVALPMADGSTLSGVFEQDPHTLPSGRIINAAHFQPGLIVTPIYTDDPTGTSGWTRASFTNLEYAGDVSRELEPSSYRRSDGVVVMVFRDQNSSYHKLASMSQDDGLSWSTPVETNMPDSRSKQSAGNLPDGTAFLVGNPVEDRTRSPLVVTLSEDGQTFDRAYLLRGGDELPTQRYSGLYKTLGYNYPKSTVFGEYLYVGYATNKEDVQLTRVPLASLSD